MEIRVLPNTSRSYGRLLAHYRVNRLKGSLVYQVLNYRDQNVIGLHWVEVEKLLTPVANNDQIFPPGADVH